LHDIPDGPTFASSLCMRAPLWKSINSRRDLWRSFGHNHWQSSLYDILPVGRMSQKKGRPTHYCCRSLGLYKPSSTPLLNTSTALSPQSRWRHSHEHSMDIFRMLRTYMCAGNLSMLKSAWKISLKWWLSGKRHVWECKTYRSAHTKPYSWVVSECYILEFPILTP
jgi:hypothetical protein